MNKAKRIVVLALSLIMLIVSMSSVLAETLKNTMDVCGDTRMYSTSIELDMAFVNGKVEMSCMVSAPYSTTSISLLYVLREENAAGNLVIADTWSDSGTGYDFDNGYSYSPAIEGREYELSVRVGIYDENGLVGYDYKTISAVN